MKAQDLYYNSAILYQAGKINCLELSKKAIYLADEGRIEESKVLSELVTDIASGKYKNKIKNLKFRRVE